jgi:acyl dehydratase|tara:strand:+ start:12356 stop:12814 length:459 start_codon:yes stop_codon:yes gene_type:complete
LYVINSIEDAKALEGREVGVSDWVVIDQARIDKFASATGDDQWIHIDQARAAMELPEGKTIAHGYLTLSLIPNLTKSFIEVSNLEQMINFGCNKVRFYAAVSEGDKVRARGSLIKAKKRGGMMQLLSKITIDIKGKKKPACIVEMLVLLVTK